MPATIMDRSAKAQASIESRKKAAIGEYPHLWRRMIAEWLRPEDRDRAWLLYSANYLFATASVRWALDPLTLHWRLPEAPRVDIAQDLRDLSFILLTHSHADHLDLELVHALSAYPIQWVVPEYLMALVAQVGLSRENIIVPRSMEPVELQGIKIIPFDGLHWETDASYPAGRRGVPATAYLVEFSGKRWLFPGDIRTYASHKLPSFGPVAGLFAHLWLGRGSALKPKPPLLETFCSFCLDLQPGRIILTHLEEFGRAAQEFWDDIHAGKTIEQIHKIAPLQDVSAARMGDMVTL